MGGDGSLPASVRVWDVADVPKTGAAEDAGIALCGHVNNIGGVDAAVVDGRPLLFSGEHGRVNSWDLRTMRQVGEFAYAAMDVRGLRVLPVGGAPRVIIAGGRFVRLGDPRTGTWSERLDVFPEADDEGGNNLGRHGISCMDAAEVAGRPVAVMGTGRGRVYVWDLAAGRLLAASHDEHREEVFAVAITEVAGEPVMISGGRDARLRLWPLGAL